MIESECFLTYNNLHSNGIIPKNFSTLELAVSEELTNKQTNMRQTHWHPLALEEGSSSKAMVSVCLFLQVLIDVLTNRAWWKFHLNLAIIFLFSYFHLHILFLTSFWSQKSEALDSFTVIKNVPFRNYKIWGLYYTILNVLLHFNGKDSYKIYMSDFKYHSPSPSLISKLGFQKIMNRRNENINIKWCTTK